MSVIGKWWYRVSGQQQRDEIAAIRSMANRYGDAALSLVPEIVHLTQQVGIERRPAWGESTADQCTPTRWASLTGFQWRTMSGRNDGWSDSQLTNAQEHAGKAFDYAESAISYADQALAMLTRLDCQPEYMRHADNSADAAREMALAAHRHMLQGQAAYGQHERLHAAELASAPPPVPVSVEQPIPWTWPVPAQVR